MYSGIFHGSWRSAVATVISQVVSVVLCVIHIKKHFPILQVERRHFKLKKTEVRTMLSGGLSMGMMSSLVNLGTLILQTGINTLGTSVIVAHTAARKVFEIWGLPVTVLVLPWQPTADRTMVRVNMTGSLPG